MADSKQSKSSDGADQEKAPKQPDPGWLIDARASGPPWLADALADIHGRLVDLGG